MTDIPKELRAARMIGSDKWMLVGQHSAQGLQGGFINAQSYVHKDKIENVMEWQPIETAPNDETRVLVTDGHIVRECRFKLGEWCDPVYTEWFFDGDTPTHWMPLPAPPAS